MASCEFCILEELKPILLMVLSQIANGSASIFYKVALADGMKIKILVLYRLVFATVFITPLALIFERGALSSNLYGESLKQTSATYAAAMSNLTPAVILVLTIIFRMEKLDTRTSAGKAKILGTVLGIGGAMVLTFFKGIKITIWSTHINLLHQRNVAAPKNQVLGSLLALLGCLSYASWLIVQTKISGRYPCYSSTALMCFMGSIQAGIYALCTEGEDWSSWKLGWNTRLLASSYSGIVSSGIVVAVMAWCTAIKGPLFVSSFNPLGPVFIAIVGSLCLDEMLHLGSILGSILIILGLYIVLWGKGKKTKADQSVDSESKRDLEIASFSVSNQAVGNPTFPSKILIIE